MMAQRLEGNTVGGGASARVRFPEMLRAEILKLRLIQLAAIYWH